MWPTNPGDGSFAGATSAAATTTVTLNEEQRQAAHAPLDEALAVVAAAGTGKTTTMLERCVYMASQASLSPAVVQWAVSPAAAQQMEVPTAPTRYPCTGHTSREHPGAHFLTQGPGRGPVAFGICAGPQRRRGPHLSRLVLAASEAVLAGAKLCTAAHADHIRRAAAGADTGLPRVSHRLSLFGGGDFWAPPGHDLALLCVPGAARAGTLTAGLASTLTSLPVACLPLSPAGGTGWLRCRPPCAAGSSCHLHLAGPTLQQPRRSGMRACILLPCTLRWKRTGRRGNQAAGRG